MSDMQKKQNFLQGTALLAMATAIVKVIGALYKIPLNAIIGLSDLAEGHVEDPEKVREYLKKINFSSRQLLGLINDILDMSRMEQGKLVLNSKEFDLKKCMEECVETFRFQAEAARKTLELHVDVRSLTLSMKAKAIGQRNTQS